MKEVTKNYIAVVYLNFMLTCDIMQSIEDLLSQLKQPFYTRQKEDYYGQSK